MQSASKLLVFILILAGTLILPARAETEKRIAFVVGNAAYEAGPHPTAANDAGLVAQTLQVAGFDVSGARDLDGASLRAAFRDFLDKAQEGGPDTVAFVYLAGYGVQFGGENYFVPVDAKVTAAADVPVEALRLSDYTTRLAGLPLKASFVVLDAARTNPFAKSGQPLASGLALADAEPNMLIAFNAAPGTVAPASAGGDSYGAYARALAEMIREGGLSPSGLFDGVRLRVSEVTQGAEIPWHVSRIEASFVFFERAADAPPPAFATSQAAAIASQPIGGLGPQGAYAAALERDTVQGYEEFLAAYPSDPMAPRIRALLAARRESITWRRTLEAGTPAACWSYLKRYPRGPHAGEARRRLATLAAPPEPPPAFTPIVYDIPPPPPAETVYISRPVLVLSDPLFAFAPPPPIPFLAPPPAYLIIPPPPPPPALYVLPAPVFVPVPVWIRPPRYVAPPPNNVIFANIHNTAFIKNINGGAKGARDPAGAPRRQPGPAAIVGGAGAGAAQLSAAHVALPPSIARKAALTGGPDAPRPGSGRGEPSGAAPPGMLNIPRREPGRDLPRMSAPDAAGAPAPGKPGQPLPKRVPPGHDLPGTALAEPETPQGGKAGAPSAKGVKLGRGQPGVDSGPGAPPGKPSRRGHAVQGGAEATSAEPGTAAGKPSSTARVRHGAYPHELGAAPPGGSMMSWPQSGSKGTKPSPVIPGKPRSGRRPAVRSLADTGPAAGGQMAPLSPKPAAPAAHPGFLARPQPLQQPFRPPPRQAFPGPGPSARPHSSPQGSRPRPPAKAKPQAHPPQ
ncbi:MAG TPA: caspase family protein [Methylocella sp.]|nr:caspase family protein [Methylocella sp.]